MKIQVLGRGLIPRGQGIAPRKEPFEADINTIKAIMQSGEFKVNMLNPDTGKLIPLTNDNLMRMWAAYGHKTVAKSGTSTPVTHPTIPQSATVKTSAPEKPPVAPAPAPKAVEEKTTVQTPTQPQKQENESHKKPEEKKDTPTSEKKEDRTPKSDAKSSGSIKVVNNPNDG